MSQDYRDIKTGEKGAVISIIAYIFLSVIKLVIGTFSGSEALRADGLNNTTDIIASVAVLVGLKISRKPPDEDHPYGHWRSEQVASLIASFIMMTVGLQVLYQAFLSVIGDRHQSPDWLSAWTALGAAVVMYGVYWYNRRLAEQVNSQSLMAAAKDNRSDAWVSIGAAVGIIGSQFGLPWLDPVTAIIVGLLICKTAWDIFKESSHRLTDGFDENQLTAYKQTIFRVPGVKEIGNIKARTYGSNVIVDVVIHVNPELDVKRSHDITQEVEKALINQYDIMDAQVHVEPKE
ncbi:cation diffusion facilitator family transporter [Tuberibacillus sp. Marseille-P3662]|uniref:cation diffusion facilitator family transporter n=1 Tax=Tuberibacillus sp. Marseille-P3662 TaxID=1965358 RepID=UPI000A1C92FC|nr:cation diffusion facilitator family transporter [Tuberibacillus sp. Marseille-P3662]